MGLEKQGSKPKGMVGKIIGRMMNAYHTKRYTEFFEKNLPADEAKILDIGCGGGKFLKYLAGKNKTYSLYGLDHSPDMVAMSKKLNRESIDENRMVILAGSVMDIPLNGRSLNLVTAFETVHFWPDIQKSFAEVHRVLKPEGQFVIINLYPKEGTKWWKLAKMKTDSAFKHELEATGFVDVKTDLHFKKGWIVARAIKA